MPCDKIIECEIRWDTCMGTFSAILITFRKIAYQVCSRHRSHKWGIHWLATFLQLSYLDLIHSNWFFNSTFEKNCTFWFFGTISHLMLTSENGIRLIAFHITFLLKSWFVNKTSKSFFAVKNQIVFKLAFQKSISINYCFSFFCSKSIIIVSLLPAHCLLESALSFRICE